jgi:hypothetical protein
VRLRPRPTASTSSTGSSADWLTLAVDALATYRLVRLATADVISEPARMAVVRSVGAEVPDSAEVVTAQEVVEEMDVAPKLATLVTCRWCAGVWIAAGVTGARLLAPRTWAVASRGLALSAAAVLLARLETDRAVGRRGQARTVSDAGH